MDGQTLCPRRAYGLRRYHTWPMIKGQSAAEHHINVWRILYAIWPRCPAHVLTYALIHDLGETVTGDLPYPVKSVNGELAKQVHALEDEAIAHMVNIWSLPELPKLDDLEQIIFKLAEYIEMLETGLDEIALGNANAKLIVFRMHEAYITKIEQLNQFAEKSSASGSIENRRIALIVVNAATLYVDRRIRYHGWIMEQEV